MEQADSIIFDCGMEEGPGKVIHGELTLSINNEKMGQVHSNYLIDKLLVEFEDLFAEPNTLPLTRNLDYSINLKPDSEPVNIRTYRYSPTQKT